MNTFVLVLVLSMPGNTPNVTHRMPVTTIDECWKEAGEFVKKDFRRLGADGIAAACEVHGAPESDG
jgi:hypothetical protein